jgi:hypothetical protein
MHTGNLTVPHKLCIGVTRKGVKLDGYNILILSLSRDNCFGMSAERRQSLGFDWHPTCLRCQECGKVLYPGQHAEVRVNT